MTSIAGSGLAAVTARSWLLAILALPCMAGAATPGTNPLLRIDPGMHTSRITSISTDAQGRWLVTASLDMTARIWDIASGKLLNVLRPPIDAGDDSLQALDAAALSPDGNLVALGGRVGRKWGDGDTAHVFIFERANGRMIRRIEMQLSDPQWWSTVAALKFSADGRLLAVGLEHEGLRLYEAQTGREIARDRRSSIITGVDFSPDSRRLIASGRSAEGSVLLVYDVLSNALHLNAKVDSGRAMFPMQLSDARFSPDGSWIAVTGSAEQDAVEVLDSHTLDIAWTPSRAGITRGIAQLDLLGWSADGRLFATGNWQVNGAPQVRIWDASRSHFHDLNVAGQRLFDLTTLPDGRMAFATIDPAWGLIAANGGALQSRTTPPTVNFSAQNQPGRLDVSPNGRSVQFRFTRDDPNPIIFDLDRGLVAGHDNAPLQPAPPGLAFDLRDPNKITLDGRPLAIGQYTSGAPNPTCLYVAHDRKHFALCARAHLLFYGADGRESWHRSAPGGVINLVAISADGHWVIAACGDGTIRWYRTSDGAEQLALFVHADRKRWVLWSPSGFYTASPAGEDLVGWHINRGKNAAADFYPLSRCRERYFRPDVIARVLNDGDESQALRSANTESGRSLAAEPELQSTLPPTVTILASSLSAGPPAQATLNLALRAPAEAPVTNIRTRVNGVPVSIARGQSSDEIIVPLPPADAVIQVFAENKNATSVPALLQVLKSVAPDASESAARAIKPKLYVLAVGISNYDNPGYRLQYAAKDATDFAKAMQKQKGTLYRDVELKVLIDDKARRDAVLAGLQWLRQSVTAADIGILLLAGHGLNDRRGTYYYAPANIDLDALDKTGVAFTEIKRALANVAGRAVFFVDTCHSGNALGGRRVNVNGVINDLTSAETSVAVLSASTGRQEAQESAAWGHGAFTKAILEGVGGAADYEKSGQITLKMMDLYLSLRVKELTAGQQTPVIIAPFGLADFEIASH